MVFYHPICFHDFLVFIFEIQPGFFIRIILGLYAKIVNLALKEFPVLITMN